MFCFCRIQRQRESFLSVTRTTPRSIKIKVIVVAFVVWLVTLLSFDSAIVRFKTIRMKVSKITLEK